MTAIDTDVERIEHRTAAEAEAEAEAEATIPHGPDDASPADESESAAKGLVEAASTVWNNPDVLLEKRVARTAVVGAVLGIVAFVVGIGALGLWVGLDAPAALGLGAFTGFWGGLGFGGMIGGVIGVNRAESEAG